MGKNHFIDIQKLYKTLRYNDYSFENGLGEIVDNAVQSGAGKIIISFERKPKHIGKKEIQEVDKITVADNGRGMDCEVLSKCLIPGYSSWTQMDGRQGIGRFGMGLLVGSLSIAKQVEVYSRDTAYGEFYSVGMDMDNLADPAPVVKDIPLEYRPFFEGQTGTVVTLSACDRLGTAGHKADTNEMEGLMTAYLGRTYRKFIEAGLKIYLNGRLVCLHDPLYVSGPTMFDTKEKQDPKAEIYTKSSVTLPVPGRNGETADVSITVSLLPEEWRTGDWNTELKKRKIDQNEGISILRAGREVLYGKSSLLKIPYQKMDRWWGCEISFPPELDDYFKIKCIKRGAEPTESLNDKLNEELQKTVIALRKVIDRDIKQTKKNQIQNNFEKLEDIMNNLCQVFPRGRNVKQMTDKEERQVLEYAIRHSALPEESKAVKLENVRKRPMIKTYTILPVKYPQQYLFTTENLSNGRLVVNVNINHPFYEKVIFPLYEKGKEDDEKTAMTIMLFILGNIQASSMFQGKEQKLIEKMEEQWGTILSAMISRL